MKKYSNLMKSTTLILAIAVVFGACKKEVFDQGLTKEFSIQSASDGANYNIKVGLPAKYNSSTEKYATLYVLDGEENFEFVANECKKISDNYGMQNVLVISIGYGNDRNLDYTPTKTSSTTGGAPQFLHFLETQLIPKIEQDFRAITRRDSRIILGHSYAPNKPP